jgi:DNA-binding response OmpR family regulator
MKILIAEDDAINSRILHANLVKWGHEVISTVDGAQAWEILKNNDAPMLVILDWMMPEIDGVELCRRIRKMPHGEFTYIILLTAKTEKQDIVEGLGAGANDYVSKPFNAEELQARVRVGQRVIELQNRLIEAERNRVLTQAAGAAAHEINQPLTVLIGMAELTMLQIGPESPVRDNISAMYDSARRISEIVKKMAKIRQYVTKPYLDGIEIIDIDAASKPSDSQ